MKKAEKSETAKSETTKSETILVVDDDRAVRQAAADGLRRAGYRVLEASSGKDALAALDKDKNVDLLLTDIQMQKMDGGELAETAQERRPELRVLFMSGYTGGAALHDSVRDEGPSFIAKPFVMEVLLKKVRAVLALKSE
ncbi:MAG TPA: response regulator [Gemmatimonadales bacterium]